MNIDNESNIINTYENIYIYSKRYMILLLSIVIWIAWYIIINNFHTKWILPESLTWISSRKKVADIEIRENPFILQTMWNSSWLVLPKNSQRVNQNTSKEFDLIQYMDNYIYQNPNNSWHNLEKHINENINWWIKSENISVNNDIINYFNLSCAISTSLIDFSQGKLCQNNLSIFVNTFPKYKIDEDLLWFEKLVMIANSWYHNLICKNLLQYIYKEWKIYQNFDTIMWSCKEEKPIYDKIIDIKRFARDEKIIYNNKRYASNQVNEMKIVSQMQDIYKEINNKKINTIEIKRYINFLSQKTYMDSPQNNIFQNIIYILNNKIKEKLNIYKSKDNINTEDIWYIDNIIDNINNINSWLAVDSIYKEDNLTGSWIEQIIEAIDNEQINDISYTKDIDKLISKYIIWSKIDENKLISKNKYLYKISIWNTKRWFLVIKNDQNIWMMKTLFIGKSNGIYSKVNDFSVNLDDSEQKRFDAFMSKYQEIYNKLNQ